ncbi:MAG: hypothetical protein BGO39_21110 [Chloroflexi bacterium 54-19]|nr:MAG: hypothetical protein BGO39_21110 [Chloroflexi bacterium 54-19]
MPPDYERVGPVEKFGPADDPYGVTIRGKNVIIYNSGSSFYVFSDYCTHQGCQVEYATRAQKFICPCHGSEFTKTGAVTKGPALTSLARFEFKIVGEIVYADLTHL